VVLPVRCVPRVRRVTPGGVDVGCCIEGGGIVSSSVGGSSEGCTGRGGKEGLCFRLGRVGGCKGGVHGG